MKRLKINNVNKKIIFINLIVLFIFLLTPPTALLVFRSGRDILTKIKGISKDRRANSSEFRDKKFSNQLFMEKDSLVMEYKSFIGWRPKVVNLKYTNIEKPYHTRYSINQSLSNSTWFFGGSTIWGFGSSNIGTIPSIYARKKKSQVFNFGEQGWVSRQSLNQLISALGDEHYPEVIIFYSGVNDIGVGCAVENKNVPFHSRQNKISALIKYDLGIINLNKTIKFLLEPYSKLKGKLSKTKSSISSSFDCLKDEKKANLISNHLVNNWYSAYLISKANQIKFFAILQPYNHSPSNYIKVNRPAEIQSIKYYDKIYPLIKNKVKEKCLLDKEFCSIFVDGSKWINANSNYFFDDCHLTEEGNEVIADRIISLTARYQENY